MTRIEKKYLNPNDCWKLHLAVFSVAPIQYLLIILYFWKSSMYGCSPNQYLGIGIFLSYVFSEMSPLWVYKLSTYQVKEGL